MQAWRVHDFGEPGEQFVLDEVPEPKPADFAGMGMDLGGWVPLQPGAEPFTDWVLMRMSAAALALPDVTMARGTYPVPVLRPYISGQEGVGVVVEASPGRQDMLGKRVAAVCIQPWGSLAPIAVGISSIFEVPDDLTDEDAAGYMIAAHTAYHAAIRRGGVTSGETVLVTGAAGGIGSAAIQLCVAAGARVLGMVGGKEKADFVRELGAEPIDHQSTDVVAEARRLTNGEGVNVIVDPVQGEAAAVLRGALGSDGRHVLCGHAGGLVPHNPNFYLFNHTLVGVTLGGYSRPRMKEIHAETQAVLNDLRAKGQYRPLVTQIVDFADVPQAVTDLAERRTMGRVVVRINP
ncbi:MAG TPA: zinc-binding dehydrogenase [Frankiaceae bacterium]|jgi:NADPH2:quinone reductase|nr:zinc-binding dehydrogenase [Frankiaceae bacterium]